MGIHELAKCGLFPNYLKNEWLQATLPVPAEGKTAQDTRHGRWGYKLRYTCTHKNGTVDFRMILERPEGTFETRLIGMTVPGHKGYALTHFKIDNKEQPLKSRRDIFNNLYFLDRRLQLMRLYNVVPKPRKESNLRRVLSRLLPVPPKYRC